MVEYRYAIQDYTPSSLLRKPARSYLKALAACLKAGKEGYSHEMLFAAHLYVKLHEFKRAAEYFTDTAKQFEKEKQTSLANESYLLASQCYEKSGNSRLARKLIAASNT